MADRSIQSRISEGFGSLHVDTIDANTTPKEQFTESRIVDGKELFLSPEGASQLDAAADRSWTVHVNGSTFERLKAALDEWRAGL